MKFCSSLLAAVTFVFAAATPALAAGDAVAGKSIFNRCKACHDVSEEKNKVGPHLVKIIGRPAASAVDFAYSDATKAKAAEGLIWTEENIAAYMKAPKEFIPDNKMAFSGLKKDDDIANLIEYLKADPKP